MEFRNVNKTKPCAQNLLQWKPRGCYAVWPSPTASFWPITTRIPQRASDSLLLTLIYLACFVAHCFLSLKLISDWFWLYNYWSILDDVCYLIMWRLWYFMKAMIPVILFYSVLFYSLQQGVIVAGGEEYLIEPLVSPDNQTGTERGERTEGRPHVVYKRSSLRHQYKGKSCGVVGKRRDILGFLLAEVWSRLEE